MNGFGARSGCDVKNLLDVEVRLRGGRWADGVRFVRLADVQGSSVYLRVHSDGGDSHFVARANDAHRDFPAIRNEDLPEHVNDGTLLAAPNRLFYLRRGLSSVLAGRPFRPS